MNHYEEELQNNIEAGRPTGADDADVKAYREVFRALSTLPETSLPNNFADRIVARIEEKRKRESKKDVIWFASGIGVMVLVFVATILYTGFQFDLGFLNDMSGYAGLFIFGVAFILILNILDKKLVIKSAAK